MAAPNHLLYTPEAAATSTLAATRYQSTLARLVSTSAQLDPVPGAGATVTVKRPVMIDKARIYSRENRANEDQITYSDLFQPYDSVRLTDQIYNAVKLPDDFATFTITDLEAQVIAPMAQSVADAINRTVVSALESVEPGLSKVDKPTNATRGVYVGSDGKAYATSQDLKEAKVNFLGFQPENLHLTNDNLTATYRGDVLPAIRAAHQLLSLRGVSITNRVLVVGANWEAALLDHPQLQKINESGDGVLRQATLGRLYGFTIVADYTIGANDAYALQREGVVLATRATAIPRGAAFAKTIAQDGFTLRYLQDYDPNILTDRAVVDTFAGAKVIDPQRIVRLTGADTMIADAPAPAADSGAAA